MCDFKEVRRIRPRHIGHTADLPFPPKQTVVIESWHLVQVDCIHRNNTAFPEARKRLDHHCAARRKGNRAIKLDGWPVLFCTNPLGLQRGCPVAIALSSRGDEDLAIP